MSKQIAVRLPDEMVAKIDALVAEGAVTSRAMLVESALEREFRRRLYEHEIEIFDAIAADDPDDLDGLARWSARRPLDLD